MVNPTEKDFYLLSGTHFETLHCEGKMKEKEKNISCGILDIKKPARGQEILTFNFMLLHCFSACCQIGYFTDHNPERRECSHQGYICLSTMPAHFSLLLMRCICFCIICALQPDNLLASVLAHPVLSASGLPGRNRRFVPPSSAASAAASVLASLSSSQQPHAGRSRSHTLLSSRPPHDDTMYCSDHTVGDR